MKTEEIDKRIGMPDIDAEWAKFEREVIGTRPPSSHSASVRKNEASPRRWHLLPKNWTSRAAVIGGIVFLLSGAAIASAVIASKNNTKLVSLFATGNDDPIYDVVEKNPAFPGSMDEFWKHFMHNLHYPQAAQDCGVYGRVIVQFVVEKDGRCTHFKILKHATSHQKVIKRNVTATGDAKSRDFITQEEFEAAQKACDDEALRVCRLMGKWTPGEIKGQPVRTHFTMPVSFRLK